MFIIFFLVFVCHHVRSEDTTHYCRNIDYRLTSLEVSTADTLSKLREDIKEGLTNQQNSNKALELKCVNSKVPDIKKVETCEIDDIVKTMNDRFKHLENVLSEIQNSVKNVSYSRSRVITDPKNCAEVNNKGSNGVYTIKPGNNEISAFCDLTTDGGGWTVIQSRKSGDVDFYKGWDDYKKGFGNLEGDFWLGLETIHQLTNAELNEILIELQDWSDVKQVAKYSSFLIGTEEEGYSLKLLGTYSGDAGDSLSYHAGQKFSTRDKDQDQSTDSCAQRALGAWWFKACMVSNLNGQYVSYEGRSNHLAPPEKGVQWRDFRRRSFSMKTTRMLIRPLSYKK